MSMKKTIIIFLSLIAAGAAPLSAQTIRSSQTQQQTEPKEKPMERVLTISEVNALTDAQLDTMNVKKKLVINDYSMVGVHYGVGLSRVMWNPSQKQEMVFMPYNIGVTYTKYGKMFGYMPYFGLQAGILFTQEGYQFKYNEDKDYIYRVEGAEKAIIDVVEVPLLFQFHLDMWNFKIMANIGAYGGYRLSIERFAGEHGSVAEEDRYTFMDTDIRWDYGIKGGVGFGIVFDPFEIHFQASYKHSFASLYEPDHYSKYYYRFAYPSNIVISAGLHFHISRRTGMSKADIRRKAREIIYKSEENGNTKGTGR